MLAGYVLGIRDEYSYRWKYFSSSPNPMWVMQLNKATIYHLPSQIEALVYIRFKDEFLEPLEYPNSLKGPSKLIWSGLNLCSDKLEGRGVLSILKIGLDEEKKLMNVEGKLTQDEPLSKDEQIERLRKQVIALGGNPNQ